MKITDIKRNDKQLTANKIQAVVNKLNRKLTKAGFKFDINQVNTSRIDITGPTHGKGPQRKNCNYRVTTFSIQNLKKGYKKSYKPTWNQYVQFNNIVNDCLDLFKVSAAINSRDFKIRCKHSGRVNSWDTPHWETENQTRGHVDMIADNEEEAKAIVDEYSAKPGRWYKTYWEKKALEPKPVLQLVK